MKKLGPAGQPGNIPPKITPEIHARLMRAPGWRRIWDELILGPLASSPTKQRPGVRAPEAPGETAAGR